MLIFILQQGRIEFVKMYLRLPGVDVNIKNSEGETPLNGAAYVSYIIILNLLSISVCNINCF